MDIIVKILEVLNTKMSEPHSFEWFHLLWIVIVVLAAVLFCKFIKATEKSAFNMVLISTIVSALLEAYKQINYTYVVTDGVINTDYQWYAFPFQFCAMPMYIGTLYCVFSKTRVRHYFAAFLATYSVFGGLVVFVYPEQVFIDTIGINIQTMVYHGAMIVVGVWLLYTEYVKLESKTILKALPVFAGCIAAAMILNEVMVATKIIGDETFNMFYISPHFEGTLPLYCEVQKVVPYPWNLFIYIIGFTAAAYIILAIAILCKKLFSPSKQKETVTA